MFLLRVMGVLVLQGAAQIGAEGLPGLRHPEVERLQEDAAKVPAVHRLPKGQRSGKAIAPKGAELFIPGVYGGSLEFVLASLLLGVFSPLSAFLMALMIQARHLFYGLAMLERYKGYGWRSFYMIFAMSDETFSITCSATPPEGVDKGWFMFFITLLDQLYWVGSAGLGAALGTVLPFSTEGVDFVMTAMFTVIFLNQWEKDQQHGSALIGLAVPLVCLMVFGSGSFLLPSMGGILVLLLALRRPMEKAAGEVEK